MAEGTAEKILMREFQSLKQEKWVNVEVIAQNSVCKYIALAPLNILFSSQRTRSRLGMSLL